MKLLHSVSETIDEIKRVRREGRVIGLVPTMGALHEGHLSLVRMAVDECGFVVVSVFVNPTQFGAGEDLEKYPRALDADIKKCEEAGVDLLFAPSAGEMYPDGFDSWVEVNGVTECFEGALRPDHFRGVATVCSKLFNITRADCAYFGMKDYQQLKVIEKMVRDLNLCVHVVPVQTARDSDGLALSSRNAYLSKEERGAAVVLNKSLLKAKRAYVAGQRDATALQSVVRRFIEAEPLAAIDYVSVVDSETLLPVEKILNPVVALLAVRIGSTRLLDCILLK